MRILFVSNQGGQLVVDLKVALARALLAAVPTAEVHLAVLRREEALAAHAAEPRFREIWCFENFKTSDEPDVAREIERLGQEYATCWSMVLAGERTFIDASMLLGGAGERSESRAYAERLVIDFVRFFERVLATGFDLVVAQTPDSFMTFVLYRVAAEKRVPVRGLSPGWLTEGGKPGGFLTSDEFLHAPAMQRAHDLLKGRTLQPAERERVERFRKDIVSFDGNKAFYKATGKSFGRSAISPNARNLWNYLARNASRRAEIEYFKVDPWAKLLANVKRVIRKRMARRWLGAACTESIPKRSVFYPLHFQPEASTLIGGVFYANQIGLIEALAKSLPIGCTLVLKEHPAGRGTRPVWQYRYLSHYPNVVFCDAPSKDIVRACDAVVTITGTIAIEAMALDRPVILFGDWFYDHAEVLYRCRSFNDLPDLMRRLLIEREYEKRSDRSELIARFLLSYLQGIIPEYPNAKAAPVYIKALLEEIGGSRS